MKATLLKDSPKKIIERILSFEGLDTFLPPLYVKRSNATDLRNVDSEGYPALKVRNGKTVVGTTLTTPNALGQRNNQYIHVVDTKAWKYWNGSSYTSVHTLSANALGEFKEFATGTTKYIIHSNGTDRHSWDGSTVTELTNAPLSKIFATHKGRVYWARDNDIIYSALNLINDYSGAGSGTLDVTKAKGTITALTEFVDRIWVFTAYGMHGLYGTGPDNYELIDIEGSVGCSSLRSVVTVNKLLYWYAYDGIYEFDGSTPIKVSEPYGANGVNGGCTSFIKSIKSTLRSLVSSGSIGDYLYISIPYGSTATKNNLTLVFNTKLRKWHIRTEGFINFVTVNNILYGVDTDGVLWDMTTTATQDNTTDISWYYITGALNDGVPSSKEVINEVWLTYKLPTGSTMKIAYSETVDENDFVDSTFTFVADDSVQNSRIQLPNTALQNVNYRRWKIYGTGSCEVYYFEEKGRSKLNYR